MGNQHSATEGCDFSTAELKMLKAAYKDLASRSSTGNTIDRNTFLTFFPLPGLHGERLFEVFDTKQQGGVDEEEFITGMSTICLGTFDDKVKFIFRIYDLNNSQSIGKDELKSMLLQVPRQGLAHFRAHLPEDVKASLELRENSADDSDLGQHVIINNNGTPAETLDSDARSSTLGASASAAADHVPNRAGSVPLSTTTTATNREEGEEEEMDDVDDDSSSDLNLVTLLVEQAFDECDLDHDGRLSFEQFKLWVIRTPEVMTFFESVFPSKASATTSAFAPTTTSVAVPPPPTPLPPAPTPSAATTSTSAPTLSSPQGGISPSTSTAVSSPQAVSPTTELAPNINEASTLASSGGTQPAPQSASSHAAATSFLRAASPALGLLSASAPASGAGTPATANSPALGLDTTHATTGANTPVNVAAVEDDEVAPPPRVASTPPVAALLRAATPGAVHHSKSSLALSAMGVSGNLNHVSGASGGGFSSGSTLNGSGTQSSGPGSAHGGKSYRHRLSNRMSHHEAQEGGVQSFFNNFEEGEVVFVEDIPDSIEDHHRGGSSAYTKTPGGRTPHHNNTMNAATSSDEEPELHLDNKGPVSSTSASAHVYKGTLSKLGRRFHKVIARWYVLDVEDNLLYHFHSRFDTMPAGVTFLEGCFVNPTEESAPTSEAPNQLGGGFSVTGRGLGGGLEEEDEEDVQDEAETTALVNSNEGQQSVKKKELSSGGSFQKFNSSLSGAEIAKKQHAEAKVQAELKKAHEQNLAGGGSRPPPRAPQHPTEDGGAHNPASHPAPRPKSTQSHGSTRSKAWRSFGKCIPSFSSMSNSNSTTVSGSIVESGANNNNTPTGEDEDGERSRHGGEQHHHNHPKNLFGIEIITSDSGGNKDRRVLYTRTEWARDEWLAAMRRASHVVPFDQVYEKLEQIGIGRFCTVHKCLKRSTNQHFAVKIIDKTILPPEDKELLRTEIAVLKLLRQPHIIRLEGVFESRHHIYIITQLVPGGDLFERVINTKSPGRKVPLAEVEIYQIAKPLLGAIRYLHSMGVTHRDIKPENILIGDTFSDIKLCDFGLSKVLTSSQMMKLPCGTLSYVAPEVLLGVGYQKEADLWSVGAMLYLLASGHLPFESFDERAMVERTIHCDVSFSAAPFKNCTQEFISLIRHLLTKDPLGRITAEDALHHPWFAKMKEELKAHQVKANSSTASIPAANTTSTSTSSTSSPQKPVPASDPPVVALS